MTKRNKLYAIASIALCLGSVSLDAQQQRASLRAGNKAYKAGNYDLAREKYQAATLAYGKQTAMASFALGNTLYQQKQFDKAAKAYEQVLNSPQATQEQKAEVYHNIGNIAMQAKEYEKAIEAYKQALIHNPMDDDTRYNLVLAQKQLQKQQGGGGGGQDQNQQDNKPNQQDKQQQDKQDPNQPQQGQQQPQESQGKENPNTKGQQQPPQSGAISKEQAEQLLNAYRQSDEATRRRVEMKERQQSERARSNNKRRW